MPCARAIAHSALWFAVLLCSMAFCPVPGPAAESTPWLEIHSAHFTVVTDAGEKKGREVALRFEQMRTIFAGLLGKDRLNQPVPLTILAFRNDESYYKAAPLMHTAGNSQGQPIDVPGFLLPGEDQDFIVLNLQESESWRAVAHDFAHLLLNYNYPAAQPWFDEGLAEYFASVRVDNAQVEIGGDPEAGAFGTQTSRGDAHPSQPLVELLNAQTWTALPELFSTKQDAPDTPTATQGSHRTLFYAESWIVTHYLLHENKLAETGSYFDLVLNQHMPVEYAIEKAYGVNSAQLQQAVTDYFHSQTALITALSSDQKNPANSANPDPAYRFRSPVGPDDSTITATPLPEDDARALYAEVQIRIPERRQFGLKELKTLATTPTAADKKAEAKGEQKQKKSEEGEPAELPTTSIGNALAHRILAWDYIQQADFDDASAEINDAIALNQNDMWIRYYLSVLKYRMGQSKHAPTQGLANMMIDLKAVLEWYPEMASAYDLLALARVEGGGPAAAMQAERAAMMLSPRDERYMYHMAQIYIAGRQWEPAENLLERLRSSANPEMVSLARERLSQIASERKFGMPGGSTTQTQLTPQKSPFDVLDEDAAKRDAQEKTVPPGGDKRPTKFLKGRLVAVDCSTAPAAILTVASGGVSLKLRAADVKSILLIGADEFSCAWQNRQVSVNYKPGGLADGDLVSLEVR